MATDFSECDIIKDFGNNNIYQTTIKNHYVNITQIHNSEFFSCNLTRAILDDCNLNPRMTSIFIEKLILFLQGTVNPYINFEYTINSEPKILTITMNVTDTLDNKIQRNYNLKCSNRMENRYSFYDPSTTFYMIKSNQHRIAYTNTILETHTTNINELKAEVMALKTENSELKAAILELKTLIKSLSDKN